jgi:hypothetical protein
VRPTSIDGEIANLRYAIQRAGIGIRTQLVTAASEAGWFDGSPISDHNEIYNGGLLSNVTAEPAGWTPTPLGWTLAGPPTTVEVLSLSGSGEGLGGYFRMADATGATTDGISQVVGGLEADALYLIVARVKKTTAEVVLSTSGAAAGTFTDLDFGTGDIGGGLGAGWHTLSGLVQADGSGSDITVSLNPDATNYDFGAVFVGMFKVVTDYRTRQKGSTVFSRESTSIAAATLQDETAIAVRVPGNGYVLKVEGSVQFNHSGWTKFAIQRQINGGGWTDRRDVFDNGGGSITSSGSFIDYPDAGDLYEYRIVVEVGSLGTASGQFHHLTVEVVKS